MNEADAITEMALKREFLLSLDWQGVKSSSVRRIARCADALYVEFANGQLYRYDAAAGLFGSLVEANADPEASVGKTFNRLRAEYPYARVTPVDTTQRRR